MYGRQVIRRYGGMNAAYGISVIPQAQRHAEGQGMKNDRVVVPVYGDIHEKTAVPDIFSQCLLLPVTDLKAHRAWE